MSASSFVLIIPLSFQNEKGFSETQSGHKEILFFIGKYNLMRDKILRKMKNLFG